MSVAVVQHDDSRWWWCVACRRRALCRGAAYRRRCIDQRGLPDGRTEQHEGGKAQPRTQLRQPVAYAETAATTQGGTGDSRRAGPARRAQISATEQHSGVAPHEVSAASRASRERSRRAATGEQQRDVDIGGERCGRCLPPRRDARASTCAPRLIPPTSMPSDVRLPNRQRKVGQADRPCPELVQGWRMTACVVRRKRATLPRIRDTNKDMVVVGRAGA
jgi:hypothetical protein